MRPVKVWTPVQGVLVFYPILSCDWLQSPDNPYEDGTNKDGWTFSNRWPCLIHTLCHVLHVTTHVLLLCARVGIPFTVGHSWDSCVGQDTKGGYTREANLGLAPLASELFCFSVAK